jgi:flagellar protein FliO/FliZ
MKWRHNLGIWALLLIILCPPGYADPSEIQTSSIPVSSETPSDTAASSETGVKASATNSIYQRGQISSQSVSSSASLLSLALGLILIVALILALGWLARRMGQGGLLGNKHIKVVSAMPLGTRERLVLVDVAGQQLLLGVTATQITHLHSFAEPVVDPEAPVVSSDFSRKLLSFMQPQSSANAKPTPDAEVN